jgi:hypothetical protein
MRARRPAGAARGERRSGTRRRTRARRGTPRTRAHALASPRPGRPTVPCPVPQWGQNRIAMRSSPQQRLVLPLLLHLG